MNLDREYTFTLRFRPWRALQNLAIALLLVGSLAAPGPAIDARSDVPPPPAKTFEQLSRESAVKAIDRVVSEKMDYLDEKRRGQLVETIVDESLSCGLDPLFTLALANIESDMDHEAVSPTGARGLYQVIPGTWKREVERRGLGRLEKFNEAHNAKVGIGYLCYLSKTFKRPDSLLLSYNQGPGGASDILAGRKEPSEEASTYAAKVWKSYGELLRRFWLPSDGKSMRALYKDPSRTVYTPILGFNGDVKGAEPRPPKKLVKKRAPQVAATAPVLDDVSVRQSVAPGDHRGGNPSGADVTEASSSSGGVP